MGALLSTAYSIRKTLSSIPEGEVFSHARFSSKNKNDQAVIKALGRLVKRGQILRAEKGKYYKPRNTRFGILRPEEGEVIRSLTLKNNKPIGYLTGMSLYNRLGLTTQVSNVLTIARNSRLPDKELSGYKIRFVTRPFKIQTKDIPLLQLLDALRDVKHIPDTSTEKAITVLIDWMRQLSEDKLRRLVALAIQYNPSTRALVGSLIESNFPFIFTDDLKKSLNPLSKFKIGVNNEFLPNMSKWNIE